MAAPTPDQLLKIARRNLAREDEVISSFNAVNRMRSAQEGFARVAQYQEPGTDAFTTYGPQAGVGLVQPPATQFDLTGPASGRIDHNAGTVSGVTRPAYAPQSQEDNLNIATAMDNAEQGTRFGFNQPEQAQPEPDAGDIDIAAVRQRYDQIRRGIDPDNPALYPSDVRSRHGGPSRRDELNHEANQLLGVLHGHSIASAKESHANLTKQRDLEVSTQVSNILDGLAQIPADGTPESAAKVAKLKKDNLLGWIHSPAVREEFRTHAKTHDEVAKELAAPTSVVVDPATGMIWNGKQWVHPTKTAQKAPPTPIDQAAQRKAGKILADSGLTSEDFTNPVSVKAITKGGKYADDGENIEVQGKNGKGVMTRKDFNTLKTFIGVPSPAQNAPAAPTDTGKGAPAASASPSATPRATSTPDATPKVVRVSSPEEARKLPPGTHIILPDGSAGVVPPIKGKNG